MSGIRLTTSCLKSITKCAVWEAVRNAAVAAIRKAFADQVASRSDLLVGSTDIPEININPVIVTGNRPIVVDALVSVTSAEAS